MFLGEQRVRPLLLQTGAVGGVQLQNQIRSDNCGFMKTLTVTEVARNFSAVMDGVEAHQLP